jgi:hypothetical protein
VPKPGARGCVCDLVVSSCCSAVLVDRAAEDSSPSDRRVKWDDDGEVMLGWMLSQTLVWRFPLKWATYCPCSPAVRPVSGTAQASIEEPTDKIGIRSCRIQHAVMPMCVLLEPRRSRLHSRANRWAASLPRVRGVADA